MESCQKIKFYRKKRNMTQDELAEAANLSTSYISQVETGRKNIGREGLEKIAEALQVLPAMLIQCDDMVWKDVKSCQIMKELEDCSDYELSVIHDILLSLKSSLREIIWDRLSAMKEYLDKYFFMADKYSIEI